jgi:hypothetical protein
VNELLEVFEPPPDLALEAVVADLLSRDPDGTKWAAVIRHTFDVVYNGQETGRYRLDQLMKTEKTHIGTLFEINAQREFKFDDGSGDPDNPKDHGLDFNIAGHDIDAKWSKDLGGWMLPPEVFGKLALVGTGSDEKSSWSLGVVRVLPEYRREGTNRDKKSQLNELGRSSIHWLWRDAPLRPNVLLQLPRPTVDHIFNHRYGTQRTNRLFREAQGMIVNRNAVATVSRQLDHQKRVRYNGGARSALAPEGIIILSGTYHADLARQLGLPVPLPDEYVSARVVPSTGGTGALIAGQHWRRASTDDLVVPAPRIDEKDESED